MREQYQQEILAIRQGFESGATGADTVLARSSAVDRLVARLWSETLSATPALGSGIALLAVGGYGRCELFPFSDVDLLFLLGPGHQEASCRDSIRRISQQLWDCGLRVSAMTRSISECGRFYPDAIESTLTLFGCRVVVGDIGLGELLLHETLPQLVERKSAALARGLADLTAIRYRKWGDTLFHLEPNIKECPGGLRDAHLCAWVARLSASTSGPAYEISSAAARPDETEDAEFGEAVEFLMRLRCFLHYRHERDDNILDWQAQDAAAAASIGISPPPPNRHFSSQNPSPAYGLTPAPVDSAYWMRHYFRHARVIEQRAARALEVAPGALVERSPRLPWLKPGASSSRTGAGAGRHQRFHVHQGVFQLDAPSASHGDPAHDPEVVLTMFAAISESAPGTYGGRPKLDRETERRLTRALPQLSSELEEGPDLWRHLSAILCGQHAGDALRMMHVLGLLELLIPEFHGIDALVIRDAYHRYTVDEHTFVLIDILHGLARATPPGEARSKGSLEPAPPAAPMAEWAMRFGQLLRDLQQPALLYLVALLHDTGKGRSSEDHTRESAQLAESVLDRLELDTYERNLVLALVSGHLEMSVALRRDIFDPETVRTFGTKVQTHEALRMLALFTYADIQAVHPDALTPWKAENLWRLYVATSNDLDRSVDDERLDGRAHNELVERVASISPGRRPEVEAFLTGLPQRYLRTRTPDEVRRHFEGATRLFLHAVQIDFHYSPAVNQMTLVTRDRPRLFATMAGALAAWGMNIVTADAFSNQQGVVVDMFRFTDAFRTLEMNVSERDRFIASVLEIVGGSTPLEQLMQGRRRAPLKAPKVTVEARVHFDDQASSHSTLMQVMAQDTSGLLYAISGVLADLNLNVEVALIDTEGEMAIDVFYLTKNARKLEATEQQQLQDTLLEAIEAHAR